MKEKRKEDRNEREIQIRKTRREEVRMLQVLQTE